MHSDMESQTSSLVSNERQLVVYLQLTSLSGEEYQVIVDLQEFDRFDEFETAVLEQLPTIGGTSTFGCELTLVRQDTGQLLCSPVWDTLRECNHFQIVVCQCSQCAEHKGQMRKKAKALRVPVTRSGQVLPRAFTHASDIRHLQVEAGIHTVGEAAWQHCTRLLIVHLPSSLLCLQEGAFRCCYVLHTVTAPGCIDFGCWAFEECHALAWVGDPDQRNNQLAPQPRLNVRAFEKCRTLRTIGLERTKYNPRDPNRVIPEGCFLGTGLEMIDLPADFSWIGPAAFEHCTRLQTVDISRTGIQEIVGNAFAGCTQLQCLKLSKTLRRIGREAFMKCSSLEVLHAPPALLYINKRAFADCTQLCKLVRMGAKGTWRGTYVEHNTFEMCTKLTLPLWIRSLPKPDAVKEEWEEFMISCAEATLSDTTRS